MNCGVSLLCPPARYRLAEWQSGGVAGSIEISVRGSISSKVAKRHFLDAPIGETDQGGLHSLHAFPRSTQHEVGATDVNPSRAVKTEIDTMRAPKRRREIRKNHSALMPRPRPSPSQSYIERDQS